MNAAIAEWRLRNQRVTGAGLRRPSDVVRWFGAIQAQEYEAAKWALGLRLQDDAVDAEIERAFEQGRILRTHVMRPTWHFVTPSDIRWLLELTAPRVQRVMSSYNRRLELDARTLARGIGVIERALHDHQYLTRTELGDRLRHLGLPMAGQRLAHLVMHAELERVVCSGPRRGKQFTYALIAERAPRASPLSRDEALDTLGRRFFRSHGPATIRDFVWWSGLTSADAKRALDMIKARREEVGGHVYWTLGEPPRGAMRNHVVHLLPIYDEYLVAYRDREAVPHGPSVVTSDSGGLLNFQHALVITGQVAGTWRATRRSGGVRIDAFPLRPLTGQERRAVGEAVHRYEGFLAAPVELSINLC
ncbi:MAG: winged helix DNA-binding domain-containing protein [Longimicrobiales bacterium]